MIESKLTVKNATGQLFGPVSAECMPRSIEIPTHPDGLKSKCPPIDHRHTEHVTMTE